MQILSGLNDSIRSEVKKLSDLGTNIGSIVAKKGEGYLNSALSNPTVSRSLKQIRTTLETRSSSLAKRVSESPISHELLNRAKSLNEQLETRFPKIAEIGNKLASQSQNALRSFLDLENPPKTGSKSKGKNSKKKNHSSSASSSSKKEEPAIETTSTPVEASAASEGCPASANVSESTHSEEVESTATAS